ncbi:MAG: 2-C-methyl-D-erythritol 4-phosphate cytidylyltransferase [Acidobacteriota bacterium]
MGKTYVIVVAAGRSLRFGLNKLKVYIRGKPVLERTIESLGHHPEVDEIILVVSKESIKQNYEKKYSKITKVVEGGLKRQDSMIAGFREIEPDPESLVLIHDGARPLVKQTLVSRIIKAAKEEGAAVPAVPIQDTIKSVKGGRITKTLNRNELYRCQTPQGFQYSVLKPALEKALKEGYSATDEASLVERMGAKVPIVPGDYTNIKVTYPEDILIAEAFLED